MPFKKMKDLLHGPIYKYDKDTKQQLLIESLREVVSFHYSNCVPYRKYCLNQQFEPENLQLLEDLPYFPTSIFKDVLLVSVPMEKIYRELNSSATTSSKPSRIGLDKENNWHWTVSLQRMLLDRIGNERFSFLILDHQAVLERSKVISARASMTRSLLFCSKNVETCLKKEDGNLSLDFDKFKSFLTAIKNKGEGVIIFGVVR